MSVKPTVLIVDDEWMLVETIAFNLQAAGFEMLKAFDGESGLKQALEAKPHLVILDVMLPHMSGWEVCQALRQDLQFGQNIPILILTACGSASERTKSMQVGANDFMLKPFSMRELMHRVKLLIDAA